jgi:hypothetical protein
MEVGDDEGGVVGPPQRSRWVEHETLVAEMGIDQRAPASDQTFSITD